MVIKIKFTPLSLSDCKIVPFKKTFQKSTKYCRNNDQRERDDMGRTQNKGRGEANRREKSNNLKPCA